MRHKRGSSTRIIFIEPAPRSSMWAARVAVGAAVSAIEVVVIVGHGKTSTMVEVKRLSVGELAARAGVATSALRFYESHGLIKSERNESGHRRYRADALRRVAFIRVAQRIGLTLAEITEALGSLPLQRTPTRDDWNE